MMAYNCPRCSKDITPTVHDWINEYKETYRVCPRNVSWTDAKYGVNRIMKKMNSLEGTVSRQVEDYLLNGMEPQDKVVKRDLLARFNLESKTSGDDIAKSLSYQVCKMRIDRTEHNVATQGTKKKMQHIYKRRTRINNNCPFFHINDKDNFECRCPEDLFKKMKVRT